MALTAQQEQDLLTMLNQWGVAVPQLLVIRRLLHQLFEAVREREDFDPEVARIVTELYETVRPTDGDLDSLTIAKGKKPLQPG